MFVNRAFFMSVNISVIYLFALCGFSEDLKDRRKLFYYQIKETNVISLVFILK
jgi:hypothetical protein